MSDRIRRFLQKPFHDKLNGLRHAYYRLKGAVYYRRIFGSFGAGSVIYRPTLIANPRYIHIGNRVSIRNGVRLEAVISNPGRVPSIRIGNNVNIEQNVHIVCHSRILIGSNVSITAQCAIVDLTHPYRASDNIEKIGDRILDEDSHVEIEDGTFLGFGCVILPNVKIGKMAVIGAHAVVTKNVPDYGVMAGNPAQLLKTYDPDS